MGWMQRRSHPTRHHVRRPAQCGAPCTLPNPTPRPWHYLAVTSRQACCTWPSIGGKPVSTLIRHRSKPACDRHHHRSPGGSHLDCKRPLPHRPSDARRLQGSCRATHAGANHPWRSAPPCLPHFLNDCCRYVATTPYCWPRAILAMGPVKLLTPSTHAAESTTARRRPPRAVLPPPPPRATAASSPKAPGVRSVGDAHFWGCSPSGTSGEASADPPSGPGPAAAAAQASGDMPKAAGGRAAGVPQGSQLKRSLAWGKSTGVSCRGGCRCCAAGGAANTKGLPVGGARPPNCVVMMAVAKRRPGGRWMWGQYGRGGLVHRV